MRVRKTIAVMLLLPLPAMAQSAAPAWIIDPSSGCRVANPNPQANESVTWSGECQYGYAEGRGVLQWFENGQPADRYDGEMHNGNMDGHGIFSTAEGGRYEGAFHAGQANGYGRWTGPGSSFHGIWTNGCFKDGNQRAYVGANPESCR